jgi:hypothetical protein
MSPKEVLNGTSPQVRVLIDQILKIEKQWKHIENVSSSKAAETQITDEILKVIYQEVAQ